MFLVVTSVVTREVWTLFVRMEKMRPPATNRRPTSGPRAAFLSSRLMVEAIFFTQISDVSDKRRCVARANGLVSVYFDERA